jgi:phytoene dehydrogenase-like protein
VPPEGLPRRLRPAGRDRAALHERFRVLESEVAARFPGQADGFRRIARTRARGALSRARRVGASARSSCVDTISDPLLEDMLLCPLMFYGSAREDDMDLDQFAIMFRALYLEGLARPLEGVRVIMRVLLEKYREAGASAG